MVTEYRPISRKYLRYLLEGLNEEDSGSGTFAQLVTHLIHRRKCANILPATEPSAWGDLGQDGRTHRVLLDSDGRFRFYASAPTTPERWIFAFSIQKDWQPKLAKDVAKIIANNLGPNAIIFVTNQFIHPERVKIEAEQRILQLHRVHCEILDGQWILNQLYEDDYSLAVEFLGCPPEGDPKLMEMFQRWYGLKESGLTEEEATEFEQLKQQIQYRNRYMDTPEHLVQDFCRMGDILAPYDARLEEGIAWYEEGLPELDRLTHQDDGIVLLYAYFRALYKLPGGPAKIYSWLPKFIDLVFAREAAAFYGYPGVWLQLLIPHLQEQKTFRELYRKTIERFRTIDSSGWSEPRKVYLEKAILLLDIIPTTAEQEGNHRWLERVYEFLRRVEKIKVFPQDQMAKVLSSLAPYHGGLAEYERCFDLALELESQQKGGFSKAHRFRDRALAHAKNGQWHDAVIMLSQAKKLWMNGQSMRDYLFAAYACSVYYSELKCFQAAEYELLEGLHLATWQPTYMEPDIMADMFFALASLALEQGRVLHAYRWFEYYLSFCSEYRVQPNIDFLTESMKNALAVATYLYKHNRRVHDRLLNILDKIDPSIFHEYKKSVLSSEEEFEYWLCDLLPEHQRKRRDLRHQAHIDEKSQPQGLIEYDELAEVQYLEWYMSNSIQDRLSFRINYPCDPELAYIAFTLATTMQIWSVFLFKKLVELSIVDDQIWITLEWLMEDDDSPQLCTQFEDEKLSVTVKVSHPHAEQIAGQTSEGILNLFAFTMMDLLIDLTLEPEEEIIALFGENEGISRFFTIAHPGYLWKTEFAELVSGVDDAS